MVVPTWVKPPWRFGSGPAVAGLFVRVFALISLIAWLSLGAQLSVLLGSRGAALASLRRQGTAPGSQRARAFQLWLQAVETAEAHELLKDFAGDSDELSWLIRGTGVAGDPVYVPWLINHMTNPGTARQAGEAFTVITGVDLEQSKLTAKRPDGLESGPNDDPNDTNVDTDADDGLPWPDPELIRSWWDTNNARFQNGTRYFMGAPVTREHCIDVLKNGYQRQRVLAAHYLCLLEPGTPLFNTSAPAWRQQRLLAKMT